jgi:hypothetical protein
MSQSDIEVSPSEPGTSRCGIEASPELVTSQPDIEASRSELGTSHFDIEASQPGAVAVKSTAVVRPVRPWVPQPYYGTVFDGVTLGAVIAATVAPTSPSIDVCWYWSNSSQTRGYWDFCQ